MRAMRVMSRVATALVATAATVALSVAAAPAARAGGYEELWLTVPTPDLANLHPGCATTVGMAWSLTPNGSFLEKRARVDIQTRGCAEVAWTPRVLITDDFPLYTYYADAAVGAAGNPAKAEVEQIVEYGVPERSAATTTMYFWGTSRLGEVCYAMQWQYDAVTWSITPGAAWRCDPLMIEMLGVAR